MLGRLAAIAALVITGIHLVADGSHATTIDVVSVSTSSDASLDALAVGDRVTIGIRIREMVSTSWLYFWIHDYDESVFDFESGESVREIGARSCSLDFGCRDGLRGSTYLFESTEGGESIVANPYESTIWLVSSNPLEPGLDGIVGGNDAQIRVTFTATGIGSTALQIDAGVMGPEGYLVGTGGPTPPVNARIVLNVVPEPSPAFLLLAGLSGLAAAGGRAVRSSHTIEAR